jgi:hypothetical protein
MRTRLAIGALGVAAGLWGVWLLSDDGPDRLVSAGTWLAGAVILHDAVLAPLVVGLGVGATRVLPSRHRPVIAIGFLVWGAMTIAAANVLIGQGGKPGMDSLLHRPYLASWLVVTLLIGAVTAASAVLLARARRGADL